MPQVPYAPVPDVGPQNVPSPMLNVRADPNAFGANVAAAIQHLGTTTEQVGNEMFERATAMQQLRNETEATEAIAEAEKRASLRYENFRSLQGRSAVDGFPVFQQGLEEDRQAVRQGLSNDMVRKLYDRQATSLTNRMMTYGAGHAAQQNKVAADGAAMSAIGTAQDRILQHPDDDVNYQNSLAEIRGRVQEQAALRGWDPDQTQRETAKAVSLAMRNRIDGLNRTSPDKAKQLLEANRQYMTYEDINHLEPKVQQQTRIVGSRNISDAVNKGWAAYMTPSQIDKMSGVQEPLTRIIQQAQRDNPNLRILPVSGFRTIEEQAKLRARYEAGGPLAARPGESAHNYGRAVDLMAGPGTTDEQIEAAMKAASAKLGIPLSPEHDRIRDRDIGHYSIPGDYDVGSAPKAVAESEESRVNRAADFAMQQYPDDPLYADIARDRTQSDFRRQQQITHDAEQLHTQVVIDRIMNRGDGQPSKNIDELLTDPATRDAYEALPPKVQATIPSRINTYNRSVAQQTDQAYLTQLRGMKETDRDNFMQIDALDPKLPLSQPARRQVIAWQAEKRKDPSTSVHIQQAHTILAPMLAGVVDKNVDSDQYWEFWGAMDDAMQMEQARTGKPPDYNQIKEIGQRLLYTVIPGGWFSSGTRVFEAGSKASSEEKAAMQQEMLKKNPYADISDRSVIRELAKKYYNEMAAGRQPTK